MKLKKVISLVLGGVLALSMLTACNGSENTTASTVVASATTTSAGTTVVTLIKSDIDADDVGKQQAEANFDARQEKDLKNIRELLAGRDNFDEILPVQSVEDVYTKGITQGEDFTMDIANGKGQTTLIMIPKGAQDDQWIADGLLDLMAARWDSFGGTNSGDTEMIIENISVFLFEEDANDATVTIDGVTYDLNDVYFIVVTMSSSATLN